MSEPTPLPKETPGVLEPTKHPSGQRDLNLKEPEPGEFIEGRAIPHHSGEWARIVGPFTWFVLSLIALVMLLPFSMLWLISWRRVPLMLDWAKTILPSATGFGGAIIGYYFGTRGDGKGDEGSGRGEESSSEKPF